MEFASRRLVGMKDSVQMILELDCLAHVGECLLRAAGAGNGQGARAPKEPVAQCLIDLDAFNLAQQHLVGASGNETVLDYDSFVGDDEVGHQIL